MIDRRIACWISIAADIARDVHRCTVRSDPHPDSSPSWTSRRR
jgi:hypothetical protein